jgi:putative multicomponent Na+:H+ antiporter subunit B
MNHPDSFIYIIVALLPLAACLVVLQVNPYHALALRGILGAIAALVYGILGAADVALTEALMGTLLAITLYAVAVRSSLVLRLGVLVDEENQPEKEQHFQELMADFRKVLKKRHMRLEVSTYNDVLALQRALNEKEIHGTCTPLGIEQQNFNTTFRIQRIYDIMQNELDSPRTVINYVNISDTTVAKLEEQRL